MVEDNEEAKKKELDEDEDSDDEAISIDFGKIKNLFKKKSKEAPKEETKKEEAHEHKPEQSEHKEEQPDIHKEHEHKVVPHEHKPEQSEHKEEHHEHKKHDEEEDSEDDEDKAISFDFSKIKSVFKSLKPKHAEEEEKEEKESDEEISVDFSTILPVIKKYGIVLLILIPIFMSVFFRVQPAILPATDEWATNSVHNYINSQISGQISQQYPNLPEENRQALINKEFNKILNEQKDQIKQQIEGVSQNFKSRIQDESGQTYLLAIDPYFWLRHVNNVVEDGHPGDKLVDNKPYNTYMYAPVGRFIPYDMFHAYFSAYLYKILSFFNPKLPVKNFFFFVPVIISSLAIIPAFFIARRISGNLGGLFAAILVAIHAGFLSRTAAGFADTDAYNVFFPLLIVWIFLEAFETKNIKLRIGLAAVAGFLTGVYSFTWGGWWYVLVLILASGALFIAYYVIINIKHLQKGIMSLIKQPAIKNTALLLLVFFIFSALFTTMFSNFNVFTNFMRGPEQFSTLQDIGISGNWPNVFTTVAEQNVSSFRGVIQNIGGKFLYIISCLGILLTLLKKDIHGRRDVKYTILLIIWIISTTYAGAKGVRYILLLVPVVSIGFGIFCGIIYQRVSRWTAKELHINKLVVSVIVIAVLALLLIGPVMAGWSTAKREIPSMNDAWYGVLSKIDMEAEPDAIINSWWDFGHWFKMIGNRAVTFDGTSQNTPMAHWVGLSLLTNNENLSIGILRMLDCGSRKGYDELNNIINEDYKSTDIMYEILPLYKKSKAKDVLLSHGLTREQAENVLKYTHCAPPQDYFITSYDMIGKSGVWAHFGSWDFRRATMFNTIKQNKMDEPEAVNYLTSEFNYTKEDAEKLYFEIASLSFGRDANDWIAPWPGYSSGITGCSRQENMLNCGGIEIDISDKENPEINIPSPQGNSQPYSIVYATQSGLQEKVYEGSFGFAVALVPDDKSYFTVMMQPVLAKSMFTTLFYYEGHGLSHFRKFDDRIQITGGRILVWNVSWETKEQNVIPELVIKTTVNEGDRVTVNYIGWDENGEVFDSSIIDWQLKGITRNSGFSDNYNYTPLTFTSMAGEVVPGFDNAIVGMNKSEVKTFIVEPEEGYGTDPDVHPLGNKTLNFRVRVEGIE